MEIKIGIRNIAREITLDIDMSIDQVVEAYTKAHMAETLLRLTDTQGRQTMINATAIGYIEFGKEHAHPVGFGTGS